MKLLPWYQRLGLFSSKTSSEPPVRPMDEGEAHNAEGLVLWTGKSDLDSLSLAYQCFRKAALLGHAGAQANLGTMLAVGQGAPRDAEQAVSWFLRAANQGDATAQFHLAVRYHRANMRGLTPDAAEGRIQALMWFLLSGAQNYHKADEWCDRLRLDMSRDEVLEAARRAGQFIPCRESATAASN